MRRQEDATLDTAGPRMSPTRILTEPNIAATNRTFVAGSSFAGWPRPVGSQFRHPPFYLTCILMHRTPLLAARRPTPKSGSASAAQQSEILDNYGKLPLSFEQNVGQFDDALISCPVRSGATVFLTPTAAVFAMSEPEALATIPPRPPIASVAHASGSESRVGLYMNIVNGNPDARPTATNQQPGITNYFIGNDPNEWHTSIASFRRVDTTTFTPASLSPITATTINWNTTSSFHRKLTRMPSP